MEDGWHKGYSLDPELYLSELPAIQSDLPEGARRFALDEDHYNFYGSRCIKDLKLAEAWLTDRNDSVCLEIRFAPNQFKHDQGLAIRYADVVEFSTSITAEPRKSNVRPDTRRLGDVQLDEILPHEKGFSHEVQMTGGSLWIVAGDLSYEWVDSPQLADEKVMEGPGKA
ncbi:hypothetical protein ACFQ1L_09230 [Phytohabitans flavus]|uniref:hypothetical protein n=1 Tax=Phytohabitans flavus TaxID=1076124 RepID=UPI001E3DDA9D|nr:hypothetical protein [Phytohabitans flavus]